MAGERRRAQKIQSNVNNTSQITYSFSTGSQKISNRVEQVTPEAAAGPVTPKIVPVKPSLSIEQLFSYDISLIYWDLAKTVGITVVMFCALIGLSFII